MSLIKKLRSKFSSGEPVDLADDSVSQRSEDVSPPLARAARFRIEAGRETTEAFVVAFVLALLFRAFLAEVFVIPTGSMAPTLMGAHKDLFCDRCDCRFEVGASHENLGSSGGRVVVAAVCPNCRHLHSLDLANNSDEKTFNGDRIVVNKYAFAVREPERWDVIVFKFPGNPKQNYIKRLVGLPGETIKIDHGNLYASTAEIPAASILRKSPSKMLTIAHLVYDTDFQAAALVKANYPSRWQAWRPDAEQPPTDSWQVKQADDSFIATTDGNDAGQQWMRYYHRWPNDLQWSAADGGESLADVDPYQSRAITDFYAYNSSIDVAQSEVYEFIPRSDDRQSGGRGVFSGLRNLVKLVTSKVQRAVYNPDYRSGESVYQFGWPQNIDLNDKNATHDVREGMHWVGELMVTANVQTSDSTKSLTCELVKAGIQYQCRLDLSNGTATLAIVENDSPVHWTSKPPRAETDLRAGDAAEIRFANFDHELTLWIDGDVVEFDLPTTFFETDFRKHDDNRPHWTPRHPLDAAPVGIAASGGGATINHLRIDRDQYYIATRTGRLDTNTEYDTRQAWQWSGGDYRHKIQDLMGEPEQWGQFEYWNARQTQTYVMDADQFFPLGDNSPGSLDARSWVRSKEKLLHLPPDVIQDAWQWQDAHYVPRNLLVGKAVFILWPHPWTHPLPITPDFGQIEMIR